MEPALVVRLLEEARKVPGDVHEDFKSAASSRPSSRSFKGGAAKRTIKKMVRLARRRRELGASLADATKTPPPQLQPSANGLPFVRATSRPAGVALPIRVSPGSNR